MRELFFEVSLDGGTRAAKAVEALKFIRDELEIGRAREGQKLRKKSAHLGRPKSAVRAAAGLWAKGSPAGKPGSPEFVEAGLGDAEAVRRQKRHRENPR